MDNGFQNTASQFLSLLPKSGLCYDYQESGGRMRRTIWLVPHVIKYREESQVVTWRCSWGNICESKCLYAMARDKVCQPLSLPVMN